MKTEVLNFLTDINMAPHEQFNKALKFLSAHGGKTNLVRSYSNRTYSAVSLESILYDVQQAFEISKSEILNFIPIEALVLEETRPAKELKAAAKKGKDLFQKLLEESSAEEKQAISLREQYPFLRDEDCPNELKALVTDKINAFISYKEKHQDLFDEVASVAEPTLTDEEIYKIASGLIKDVLENADIKKELDHYGETKEILGEHEVFTALKLEREINDIPATKLQGIYNNLKSQITKENKKPDSEEKTARLQGFENKKTLVNARINAAK